VLSRFDKVLVPELNLGQLSRLIRSEFLIDAKAFNKVEGQPFRIEELRAKIDEMLGSEA
jgi:2-oxoglutarate ferredoxin oxidoreductase subunit alpha